MFLIVILFVFVFVFVGVLLAAPFILRWIIKLDNYYRKKYRTNPTKVGIDE